MKLDVFDTVSEVLDASNAKCRYIQLPHHPACLAGQVFYWPNATGSAINRVPTPKSHIGMNRQRGTLGTHNPLNGNHSDLPLKRLRESTE